MADTLPQNFPTPSEQALISYSFTEALSGTAYIKFYGGRTEDNYLLVQTPFYSNENQLHTAPGANTDLDVDFDALVKVPITLQGRLIANIPLCLVTAAGAIVTWNETVTVKLRKVNLASVESEIASDSGTIQETNFANSDRRGILACIDFEVPKTSFKIGETIRITVQNTNDVSGQTETVLIHDPMARDYDGSNSVGAGGTLNQPSTTSLEINIPFKPSL